MNEAALLQAEWSKKIAIEEAKATLEAAKLYKQTEIVRTEGVAGETMKPDEIFLVYWLIYWIVQYIIIALYSFTVIQIKDIGGPYLVFLTSFMVAGLFAFIAAKEHCKDD